VTALLDTSVIVRYLTGDPAELAERAARTIDGEDDLLVTDAVLAETAYVLTSVYQMPRGAVVEQLITLLRKRNISAYALDEDPVLQALLMCRPSGRVSFTDAMLWAAARSSGINRVCTLDERFPAQGVEVLTPT
jgi:predicted nucleic acid-binding protein